MKPIGLSVCLKALLITGFLVSLAPGQTTLQAPATKDAREVIVSYAPANSKLQLYRVNEDGSSARRITDGQHDCMMPSWSPDGKQIVYVRHSNTGLNLWLCDPDGKHHKQLTQRRSNRIPSWLPDSKHVVWMDSKQSKAAQDPAATSQLRIMNTETMQSRRLFSDEHRNSPLRSVYLEAIIFAAKVSRCVRL